MVSITETNKNMEERRKESGVSTLNDFTILVYKQLERQRQIIISRITGESVDTDGVDMCVDAMIDASDCDKVCFMNDVQKYFFIALDLYKEALEISSDDEIDPASAGSFIINTLQLLPDIENGAMVMAVLLRVLSLNGFISVTE